MREATKAQRNSRSRETARCVASRVFYITEYKAVRNIQSGARTCRIISKCDGGAPVRSATLARSRPNRPALVDEKQLAAVCRIKTLKRLHCCALAVCGFGEGDRSALKLKFLPVLSALSFPELRLGGSASTSCSSSQKATDVLTTLVNLWLASRLDELICTERGRPDSQHASAPSAGKVRPQRK